MSDTIINIYNSGAQPSWVKSPENSLDFSMLPNQAIPIDDQGYFANRDENTIWKISKTDTEWKIIDTNNIA
jgi:hypothetical protein